MSKPKTLPVERYAELRHEYYWDCPYCGHTNYRETKPDGMSDSCQKCTKYVSLTDWTYEGGDW